MKTSSVCWLTLLCFAAALSAETTADPVPAEEVAEVALDRDTAYRWLRRGDQARQRREWAEAVHAYQAALDIYRLLARQAPAWEEDYFAFRVTYCERELAVIERESGRTLAEWEAARGEWSPADGERYRQLYEAALAANRELQARIAELEDEVELHREMEMLERERARRAAQQRQADLPEDTEP